MSVRSKRARRLQAALDTMPLRQHALAEAYEDFRLIGELPGNERLAQAVIDSAIAGKLQPVQAPQDAGRLVMLILAKQAEEHAPPKQLTLRDYLLDHAGYAPEPLRTHARLAIAVLVAKGGDITNPEFLKDAPLPGHNGIGMHVMGYPEKFATPPYVEQAHRLFARYAELRERIPQHDDAWFDALVDAALEFRACGELPDDELMRDAVLADTEYECLMRHKHGEDVSELMAALDEAARSECEEREDAIAVVQQLVHHRGRT